MVTFCIFIILNKWSNHKLSVADLVVPIPGHPTSCEGLDGDGGHTDYLVDLSRAVTSPVSLDHHCCPALLQCCSAHCFTANKTSGRTCQNPDRYNRGRRQNSKWTALTGLSSVHECTAGGWWLPLSCAGTSSGGSTRGRVSGWSRRLLSVGPGAASRDKLPDQRGRRSSSDQTCTGWGPSGQTMRPKWYTNMQCTIMHGKVVFKGSKRGG